MRAAAVMLFFLQLLAVFNWHSNAEEYDRVTLTSVLKLVNKQHGTYLNSHGIGYGSGSHQQSVTAVAQSTDSNAYWQVLAAHGKLSMRGVPIACNSEVRLLHLNTKRLLHSHKFSSPLTRNQEVSAFGESGVGDAGDNWRVVCSGRDKYWTRTNHIKLQHVDTGMYLHNSGKEYRGSVSGQQEVCGINKAVPSSEWVAQEGVYFPEEKDVRSDL